MNNIAEMARVCNDLNISFHIIIGDDANKLISKVINFFNPEQTTGHLSISNDSIKYLKFHWSIMNLHIQKNYLRTKGMFFLT